MLQQNLRQIKNIYNRDEHERTCQVNYIKVELCTGQTRKVSKEIKYNIYFNVYKLLKLNVV